MKRIAWDTAEPGHFEVDLVHHGGESTAGEYVHTIQLIDVATGWSERVAVLGRGQQAMEAGFCRILERLPFAVKKLHPDNGSEFFNNHLVRISWETITGLTLSRSRPHQKNDNRFVEQKNATLVRQYFGTIRLETPEQVQAMNVLYDKMWLYYNFFQPVMHFTGEDLSARPCATPLGSGTDSLSTYAGHWNTCLPTAASLASAISRKPTRCFFASRSIVC